MAQRSSESEDRAHGSLFWFCSRALQSRPAASATLGETVKDELRPCAVGDKRRVIDI